MSNPHDTFPRRLPRLERIFSHLDPFYFITFNTYARCPVLASPEIHATFKHFAENALSFGVGVGRYVIMPDHVYLFVMFPREGITIGEWIKALKHVLGKPLAANGHIAPFWQEGFFDHVMRSSESYAEKWNYVRMNPVRAGLCTSPDEWSYQGEVVKIRF